MSDTYRIRPLEWYRGDHCSYANVFDDMGYAAYPSGCWHGNFFDSQSPPHGKANDLESAKAACESHWRSVLSAALVPVEATNQLLAEAREAIAHHANGLADAGQIRASEPLYALVARIDKATEKPT